MMSFPWWLSFAIGFLSLSEEILWVRLVGFAYSGVPQSFSFVLGSFLLGIAGNVNPANKLVITSLHYASRGNLKESAGPSPGKSKRIDGIPVEMVADNLKTAEQGTAIHIMRIIDSRNDSGYWIKC